jgi:hypothetical protein
MPVKVHLVLSERKRKDASPPAKDAAAKAPLQVRESGDRPPGFPPKPKGAAVFLCDRKEPPGRP